MPIITACAAVVAAIISGFFAAALKHRWDVQDDERRWSRERAERRREELKSAFTAYLAARAEVGGLFANTGSVLEATTVHLTLRRLYDQALALAVILEGGYGDVINEDLALVAEWVTSSLSPDPGTIIGAMPFDEKVRSLAQVLLNI